MVKWNLIAFDDDYNIIIPGLRRDRSALRASKILSGKKKDFSSDEYKATVIYNSVLQRSIIESLLISEDCDNEEISSLTGIPERVIEIYEKLFFRHKEVFVSKIDKIDYIESGINYYIDNDDDKLNIFLMLRWALSLGKEFIIWKYRLKPVEYAPDRLYNMIIKEAFFYHKEKSMGNSNITLTEYLRSTNTLLSNIKSGVAIKDTSEEDSGLDILDQLGIIVEEKEAPDITLDEIIGADFINNAIQQETT